MMWLLINADNIEMSWSEIKAYIQSRILKMSLECLAINNRRKVDAEADAGSG